MSSAPASRQDHAPHSRPPSAMRSATVILGPSLLVLGLIAVCTLTTIRRLVAGSANHRRAIGVSAVGAVAPWVYLLAIRPRVLHWGARTDEIRAILPGDDLVREPAWTSTRAVTIAAPTDVVWPWLAQMGQEKGGLYSYEWIENLAGLDFHNADRIHTEWQHVAPGDSVRLAPEQEAFTVALAEPNHALVWRIFEASIPKAADHDRSRQDFFADATWAFVLQP